MTNGVPTKMRTVRGSADGKGIIMDFESPTGDWRLAIPLSECPALIASITAATRQAKLAGAAGQSRGALPIVKMATKDIHAKSGKTLLEISIDAAAPGLLFEISRQRLINFARGILEVTGVIAPDPSRKLQ